MKVSPKNVKIMHHIISALLIIAPDAIVVEIPAKYKTKLLNCPKGVNIKKWSPYMTFMVFRERGDEESYRKLEASRKRDDLADIVLQILAFLVKCGFLDAPDKLTGRRLQKVIALCQ